MEVLETILGAIAAIGGFVLVFILPAYIVIHFLKKHW